MRPFLCRYIDSMSVRYYYALLHLALRSSHTIVIPIHTGSHENINDSLPDRYLGDLVASYLVVYLMIGPR